MEEITIRLMHSNKHCRHSNLFGTSKILTAQIQSAHSIFFDFLQVLTLIFSEIIASFEPDF